MSYFNQIVQNLDPREVFADDQLKERRLANQYKEWLIMEHATRVYYRDDNDMTWNVPQVQESDIPKSGATIYPSWDAANRHLQALIKIHPQMLHTHLVVHNPFLDIPHEKLSHK